MYIQEYRSRDDPTVILLAPMRLEASLNLVSGADLNTIMSPYSAVHYHFVAPDQDGHAEREDCMKNSYE